MMIDRVPSVPLVPPAALAPERATPFGPHRPLPAFPFAKRDVPGSLGDVQIEKTA